MCYHFLAKLFLDGVDSSVFFTTDSNQVCPDQVYDCKVLDKNLKVELNGYKLEQPQLISVT
jgi:hypothetical protein